MFCDECEKTSICEARESWIYSAQFSQCEAVGHPDYCDDNHFIYANITDPGEEETTMEKTEETSKGAAPPPEKVKSTTRRGTCVNCKRPNMTIVSGGLDWPCYKAAKGLTGMAREEALLAAKERIDNGGLRLSGGGRRVRSQKAQESSKSPVATDNDGGAAKSQESTLQEAVIELFAPVRLPPVAGLEETAEPRTCIPVTLQLIVEISVRVNGMAV